MKIAIDALPLESGHRLRGVGVYTRGLIANLPAVENFVFKKDLQRLKKYDLIHYPYFDLFFATLPIKKVTRTVVTIHDVIPLLFPHQYPPGIRGKINFWRQKSSLCSVDWVITDSESSKKDIIKFLAYPEEKISVVYLAVGEIYREIKKDRSILTKYKLPQNFVLYVGDVNYHKNLASLAQAVKSLNLTLVVVGKQAKEEKIITHPETGAVREFIGRYGHDTQVIRLGFVSDEDLVQLYNQAGVYCQPSFYEGFGLPILEAMACGCPVVCSQTSSLPEIGGKAVIYFDPHRIHDIAKGIKIALSGREKLREKGLKQVKKFTWQKTTKETWEVYEKVVAK